MKTVLVIDDSDIVLEITKKALEGAGYRVITRNRPSGSVAAILRDKPDVVLLDLNMPTLSGDTIAKILARVTQSPDMIVLLHSSMSIDNLRLKSIASGAQGYIQKTESPTELVRRLEYWLNRRRLATSSGRIEAAPVAEPSGRPRDAPSSGRFEAAPVVPSSRGPASSGRTSAAAPVTGASASSSSRLRAGAAYGSSPSLPVAVGAPPTYPSSSMKAASTFSAGAGPARSMPNFSASSSDSAPSARDQRTAKPTGLIGDKVPKVLFVDDDWTMLNSYRMMVAGFLEGDFVSSSDDAFNRILSDTPPDFIVCDVMMPGMTGADIYRRAVLLDPKWARRFVFVTGAASTPAVAEFLNTLEVRVFHKPISIDRLLETLRQLAENPRR